MTIIIHGLFMSTGTAKVLATLLEKEVDDYILRPVDIFSLAHKKPEYLALQPFGLIPAIQDGDLTLFESRAIARYICDKYAGQGTALLGKSLVERAKVGQWLEVESHNFHPPISTLIFELVVKSYKGLITDESAVEANLSKLSNVLDVYEQHLSTNMYLAGNFYSLADLSHVSFLHYLINVAHRGEVVTSKKHVKAWWENISSRPAWKGWRAGLASPEFQLAGSKLNGKVV
ncbi:hypothetical protein O6H91_01G002900 [Diphasiastrum complanatum]|uniref:Uncharacterized protein n=1 Tax=Diphasiastrum complanatum TaxID=34168 RepID=A0ACC2EMR1_DIPCM|nr:hypothetical protein O6H91_01G002900 [Diphasiastrum complanatum]